MKRYFEKQNNPATQDIIDTFIANRIILHSEAPYEYPDNFIEDQTEYFNSKLGKQLYYLSRKEGNDTRILSVWEDEMQDQLVGFEFIGYMAKDGKIPAFQVN